MGGGPVGLGLAIDLALRGVASVVLERGTDLHRIPKGQNLTQRTGEHFRAWGVTEAIRAASPIPRSYGNAGLVTYGKLLSEYSYDWFQRSKVGAYYHALNERLPQYCTEAVLRARAAELALIDFRTGCRMTGLSVQDAGVSLAVDTADGPETIDAAYAVGCDGARSGVRELAGIAQEVNHKGPRMALLVFRSPALSRLLERFPGKSIYNVMNPNLDGYWQFLGRFDLDGGFFYHVPVPPEAEGEAYFRAHLHEMVGAEFALEFEHIGFWDLRISHAETYRAGRVFIAGDAAHSHPPYGGYGVNTGFEDARNLSWKLAARISGWGSEALLDSYSAERHAVFRSVSSDFIAQMIEDFRGFVSAYAPDRDRAAFEAAWAKRAAGGDADVTQFLPHYEGSPIVCGAPGPPGSPGSQDAQSGAKGTHRFEAQAGHHLAPQALPDGGEVWDLLGAGFTLLNFGAARHGGFDAAAEALSVPLCQAHLPSEALAKAYGAEMILVRPDQFVAWVGPGHHNEARAILRKAIGAA